MKRALFFALIGVLASASSADAADQIVEIENFTFKPAATTVHVGEHVTFKNVDDIPHSVVLTDGSYHSKALDTDDTVSVAFDRPGDYPYFCGLHPHMQGKVQVIP